ncbi:alpha/beta hydrolase [Candidatus Gracilibacteria bacterium]|nr:alpha/beta hydrolase [Candidatus Gracilibacteria bacterium]
MITTQVRFTTKDGLILQGLLYEHGTKSKRAILHVHGMSGNNYENRFYSEMIIQNVANDWAFFVINNRGHDYIADIPVASDKEEYRRIGNAYEVFEESIFDIAAAIDYLAQNGYEEIVLQGHSLGAVKIAYYCAETNDERVSRLIMISPPDMVGLAEADSDYQQLIIEAKKLVASGNEDQLPPKVIWGSYWLSAKTMLNFSIPGNAIDVFNFTRPQTLSILEKLKLPILAIMGELDDAVTMPIPEAMAILKQKCANCSDYTDVVIANAPHSYFGAEAKLAATILQWLLQ